MDMSNVMREIVIHGGVVYTMGHEGVPRLCRICDWLLNLSQDHFGLYQGEKVRVTMKFEVHRDTLSTTMVQRVLLWVRQNRCFGRKRQGSMVEKYCYNKI